MNRFLHFTMRGCVPLVASLMVSLLSAGCTNDPADDPTADKEKITLSLGTYAVNEDTNALPNELKIASAYVYIFNAGGYLENAGEAEVPLDASTGEAVDASNNLNRTWSVPRGEKNIYVLINPGRLLLDDGSQPNLANYDFTEEKLLSLRNDKAHFDADFAPDGTAGMLMSGRVRVEASGTVAVPVARRYAGIELQIRKKSDISDVPVTLNAVTLVSQNTCDYAFAKQGNLRALRQVGRSSYLLGLSTIYKNIESYYTMPQTGLSEPVRFDLDITYNGKNMTLPVYINCGALNGNTANDKTRPLDIEANKIYAVKVTIARQNIDVQVNILDWDDRTVNGDIYGASLSVTNDECLICEDGTRATEWAGDTYTVAEANYVYDGTVPAGVANSITVEGTDMSLESAARLTADKTPVRVRLGPTFTSGTVTLKFGNLTKTVKVAMKDAFDAHFGSIVCDGQTTGSEWIRNDNYCSAQNQDNGKFVVCISENVTPTGWIKYDHAEGTYTDSNASDADAEPLFEEKKAEGIIYRSDLGATKVFIRQLAPMYLGRFGSPVTSGNLTATDDGGYAKKRLIVEAIEENTSVWASSSDALFYQAADEFDEGRKIAEYLKDNKNATAVQYCLMKNDRNGNGVIDPDEPIEWYLPARRELYGAWISHEPLRLSNYPFWDDNFYWSSTEKSPGRAYIVAFDATGASTYPYDSNDVRTRCVRSL